MTKEEINRAISQLREPLNEEAWEGLVSDFDISDWARGDVNEPRSPLDNWVFLPGLLKLPDGSIRRDWRWMPLVWTLNKYWPILLKEMVTQCGGMHYAWMQVMDFTTYKEGYAEDQINVAVCKAWLAWKGVVVRD